MYSVSVRFDTWLDKHWLQALNQRGDCVFVHSRAGALLRAVLDDYCLQRNISPLRWRMTEHDALEPYSPILPLLRSLLHRNKINASVALDALQLKGAERSLFADYFAGREPIRVEFPLPDDLSFQSRRIRTLLLRFLAFLTAETPQLLLITGIQFAGPTTLKLIEELIQCSHSGKFLLVIGIDPSYQHSDENHQQLWEQWVSQMDSSGIVYPHPFDTTPAPFMNWPGLADLGTQHDYAALARCEQLLDMLCFDESVVATRKLMQRLERGEFDQDGRYKWQVLLCLGRAQLYCGEHEEAITTFDRLLEQAQVANNSSHLCMAYRELAMAHIFRSDLTTAIRYSQLAVKLGSAADDELLQTQALFVHFVACDKANIPFGLSRLHQLLQLLDAHQMVSGRIYVLRNIFAQVPFEKSLNHDSALDCSIEAIRLAYHYDYQADLAAAFQSRGVIYSQLNRYRRALRCFRISEHLREKLNVPGELARIRNGIGYMLCQRENYTGAHRYYLSALNTVLRLNDFSEITISLYNLAWLYAEVQENGSASLVLNTLREMLRIRGTTYFPFRNLHDVLLLQGVIHLHQGEWVRAEQDLERSYNLDIPVSAEGKFMRPLLRALLEAHQQNYQQALVELEEATVVCDTEKDLTVHHQILLHEAAIRIQRHLADIKAAYHHLRQAIALCQKYKFPTSRQRIICAWKLQSMPKVHDMLSPPKLELDQLLHLVSQEQRMNQLWQRVHEMRLLATLQQLAVDMESEKEIAAETLRLICTHFNAQAGFLLVNHEQEIYELAQYSQVPDNQLDSRSLSDWLGNHTTTRLLFNGEVPAPKQAVRFSSVLCHPLLEGQRQIGEMILLTFADSAPLHKSDRDILQFIGNQLAGQLVNLRQRRQLITLSSTDVLTGLSNRQNFQTLLRQELKRIARYGADVPYLSLAFIDLDNFKYYNDTFGHDIGDQLLRWFADLLRDTLRDFDVACRWGGDEFLVLFPHTKSSEAMVALVRLIESLNAFQGYGQALSDYLERDIHLPQEHWLSCSIGVTDSTYLTDPLDDAELLQNADQMLYEVKRNGKGHALQTPPHRPLQAINIVSS
jgi:diguanylate cyclase (GGDEF)-like protein